MDRERLGGVPYETEKQGSKVKVRFFPKGENPKNPDSIVFTMTLDKSDKQKLKEVFDSI